MDFTLNPVFKFTDLTLYNYGEPRVGNKNFVALAEKTISGVWRMTWDRDPIPHRNHFYFLYFYFILIKNIFIFIFYFF